MDALVKSGCAKFLPSTPAPIPPAAVTPAFISCISSSYINNCCQGSCAKGGYESCYKCPSTSAQDPNNYGGPQCFSLSKRLSCVAWCRHPTKYASDVYFTQYFIPCCGDVHTTNLCATVAVPQNKGYCIVLVYHTVCGCSLEHRCAPQSTATTPCKARSAFSSDTAYVASACFCVPW